MPGGRYDLNGLEDCIVCILRQEDIVNESRLSPAIYMHDRCISSSTSVAATLKVRPSMLVWHVNVSQCDVIRCCNQAPVPSCPVPVM